MPGQAQFYLEQDFPFHPKVAMAGGDAAWLYVCGMAWGCKHLTGIIPKQMVGQLSDRKQPLKLAARLCEVGLWHDRGDHFEIHDFEVRNAKMLAARRKAKNAAEARWSGAPSNAPSMPEALLDGCTSNALEPKNQRTMDPKNPLVSSTTPLSLVREPAEAALVEQVIEAVAQRQLQAASNVRSASGWLASARARIATEWAGWIAENDHQDVEMLVDHIEPPAKPNRDPNGAYTRDGKTFLPGTGWVS